MTTTDALIRALRLCAQLDGGAVPSDQILAVLREVERLANVNWRVAAMMLERLEQDSVSEGL